MSIVESRSTVRGFSLLELVVVILLLSILTAAGIQYTTGRIHDARRDEISKQYVADFRVVARAARAYVSANESGWTVGSNITVPLTTLIADNLLPSGFGTTQAGTSRTPTATTYRIVARKVDADLPAQVVIYEANGAAAKAYLSFGGPKTVERIKSLKADVARDLYAANVPAGVMAPSTATVTGAGVNGWTKSLTAWTGGVLPPEPSLAVLLNFPDLEPDIGPTGPNDGGLGESTNYGICRVSKQRIGSDGFPTGTATACGAYGTGGMPSMADVPYQIAEVNTCGGVYSASLNPTPIAIQDVGVGAVTFGSAGAPQQDDQATSAWASRCNALFYPECEDRKISIESGMFTLNNVTQDVEQCNVTYWNRANYFPYSVSQATHSVRYSQLICCENPG